MAEENATPTGQGLNTNTTSFTEPVPETKPNVNPDGTSPNVASFKQAETKADYVTSQEAKKSHRTLMICLLVGCFGLFVGVIAVALLSSAVLVAINPHEQISKANDTLALSEKTQLENAIEQYLILKEVYPWETAGVRPPIVGDPGKLVISQGWFQELINEAVLSPSQQTDSSFGNIYLWVDPTGTKKYIICFKPNSEMYINKANYNEKGVLLVSKPTQDVQPGGIPKESMLFCGE